MARPSKNQHVVAVLRQAIGLGQQQLAARLGVSRSVIQKMELDERCLTGTNAKRIADHTGVELAWLLAGDYTQPPVAAAGGPLTRERYDRHRAWSEGVTPASDTQMAQFRKFAQGATLGLSGGKQRLPMDEAKARRQLEGAVAVEMTLEVKRDGRKLRWPKELQGHERAIGKRLQQDMGGVYRRGKVGQLREQFERLTQAAFEHPDGDFLLWQLREQLEAFDQRLKGTEKRVERKLKPKTKPHVEGHLWFEAETKPKRSRKHFETKP